ncbi:putative beta-1,3-galactosyltransferase 11 [Hibiscus syriacus]|uniref:Hexosyltransferase n=1 Tax=Hibiscus syriacus TaxID=106335 RepID=A0A6A3A7Q1_HIBSY|nr:putative beta-1,3-galactosyltransferase 11 [Hibiscus syriacus]
MMQSKGSNSKASNMMFRTRISSLLISMFEIFASFYVAGRLWQDAQTRVYFIKELDRATGLLFFGFHLSNLLCFLLKIIACREQQKKLSALEMDLAAASREGFTSKRSSDTNGAVSKRRPLVVIGVLTGFGRRNNRDAIRATLKKMEKEKGIVSRFVIGRSADRGDNLDRSVDDENRQTNDFMILISQRYTSYAKKIILLEDQVEAPGELPKKAKMFFALAADRWDADFYAKVNDDVYVNINALGATLTSHLNKAPVHIGCMKSDQVFSEPSHKWYEPDWWKFGEKKSYFRHTSGQMYVISGALAKFISINRNLLRTYAHDDVSAGSWFLGLDVKHVDEGKFCCSSWSTGLSLSLSVSLARAHI